MTTDSALLEHFEDQQTAGVIVAVIIFLYWLFSRPPAPAPTAVDVVAAEEAIRARRGPRKDLGMWIK